MELVDIVSVALILQIRYLNPSGCSQALSIVSPLRHVHSSCFVVCLHLGEMKQQNAGMLI